MNVQWRYQCMWLAVLTALVILACLASRVQPDHQAAAVIVQQNGSILYAHHEDCDRHDFRGHMWPNGGPVPQESRRDFLQHWLPFLPGRVIAVDFEHSDLDNESMQSLATLRSIRRLSFKELDLPDGSGRFLAKCRELEQVNLYDLTASDISEVINSTALLPKLRRVTIRGSPQQQVESIRKLGQSRSLKMMSLQGVHVDDLALKELCSQNREVTIIVDDSEVTLDGLRVVGNKNRNVTVYASIKGQWAIVHLGRLTVSEGQE